MFQWRSATRWSNARRPLPSIDANQAVCPGIDAAVPLLSTQANVPETMKAACPASSVVVPNNEMVPSPFVAPSPDNLIVPPRFVASVDSSLRVAAMGLTLSAQAAMPKPTRQYRLGVPSARVAKAKGKGMEAEVKSKGDDA